MDDTTSPETTVRRHGPAFYCSWVFGVLILLDGMGSAFTLTGLGWMVMGLTLLPPVGQLVEERFAFKMTRGVKAGVIVGCFIFVAVFGGPVRTNEASQPTDSQWWEQFYADYYSG